MLSNYGGLSIPNRGNSPLMFELMGDMIKEKDTSFYFK